MAFQPDDDAAWLAVFRQHMDEMFDYVSRITAQGGCVNGFIPNLDIYASESHLLIEIDFPGFDEADFSLTPAGSALLLEGVKREERVGGLASFICLERSFGRFSRSIEIPAEFDPQRFSTSYSNGVLLVSVERR